ncbi:ImmA/IrrE family metallo-endopeptidase [Leptospira noguchii]|uniref:ImmA/IrrE family metallo-endopeptidase n=1 Tax=Leptospira noguchii TaxID=28182 RepID=A0A9Q8RPJ3_9LEPT|nr:ImmA/IrrE family metallo-endopeptidase [Leptospira noguchii]TQE73419.1 ImmA/IrrE family metallo-endopeptidase [Leptospira noguchii]UOG29498.1 ImmA/IrrE family metallo-endopeptidase [Leptospira noguchii]UOG35171.1 ImmA/IrrE family metallo-endopeptidase [Leptospira noguchii]UOG46080.1 ImmA/IrrE family metallo-endopeptidase [Leptospira noguchii]UOG53715.1 ImmA/IrrE family metallo-endopeptidase [Leptospira noguchii]
MNKVTAFRPDWVSEPSETIIDILAKKQISFQEFSEQMSRPVEKVNEILNGNIRIDKEIARQLELILGPPANFWIERENQFQNDSSLLESIKLANEKKEWLKIIPVKEMLKLGWLTSFDNSTDIVEKCLNFFGVSDIRTWHEKYNSEIGMALFKMTSSFTSEPGAIAAWIRQGEILSQSINCKKWNSDNFLKSLSSIRNLTFKKDPSNFIPELTKLCAESGVVLIITQAPTGCKASGATKFITPDKALLMLSFRYLTNDHFWFTFFHEAGHLLLHSSNSLHVEGSWITNGNEEDEANHFAANILIPEEFKEKFLKLRSNRNEVIKFARFINIHPGIVVGQLQHLNIINRSHLNALKRRYTWK